MKVAYFDCQYGCAGDMLLGALIGAGLDVEAWLAELKKLALPSHAYSVVIEDVNRCSLASKKVTVKSDHDHHAHHDHSEAHAERGLTEITQIIEKSDIDPKARALARSIFQRLAIAEGKVHGISPEKVHFHEIGAIDSIVDIVGFAIAYTKLGIGRSAASPLPLGSGTVKTEHGILPIPGPAVLELLKEVQAPIRHANIQHECLTPTGAAILAEIVHMWGSPPSFEKLTAIGYGAGDRDPGEFPNVCRLLLGELREHYSPPFQSETISVLETNLDDLSPQILSFTSEELIKLGALDVFVTPCTMKKGRSGHLLTVLCRPDDTLALQEHILRQTSTLGVRKYDAERMVAERDWRTIEFNGGQSIRLKIAKDLAGKVIHVQPEYEDCAASALRSGLTLDEVFRQALAIYHQAKD